MGQQELATSAAVECENCEQEEAGVSMDQTVQASTPDEDQHGEQHGLEEVGTEEHRSQVEEDGEEDRESESGLRGHSPLPQSMII